MKPNKFIPFYIFGVLLFVTLTVAGRVNKPYEDKLFKAVSEGNLNRVKLLINSNIAADEKIAD